MSRRLFTSESVTEGHPDKIADQISDTVLNALLRAGPASRVAAQTLIATGLVHLAGEVTTQAYVPIAQLVRKKILEIGYDASAKGFDGASCKVSLAIGARSPDIAQGVDTAYEARVEGAGGEADARDRQGAGEGLMFGYATDETPALMPLPLHLAHRMSERLAQVRTDGTLPLPAPRRQDARSRSSISAAVPSAWTGSSSPPSTPPTSTWSRCSRPAYRSTSSTASSRSWPRTASASTPTATACWSTPPAASRSAARWATPA